MYFAKFRSSVQIKLKLKFSLASNKASIFMLLTFSQAYALSLFSGERQRPFFIIYVISGLGQNAKAGLWSVVKVGKYLLCIFKQKLFGDSMLA